MSLFSLQAKLKIMSPIPACGEGSGSTIVYPSLSGFAEMEPSRPLCRQPCDLLPAL